MRVNRLAESRLVLPTAFIIATALWWTMKTGAASYALMIAVAYVLMATDDAQQLIRRPTRLAPAACMLLLAAMPEACTRWPSLLAALGLTGSHYTLFRAYQRRDPVVDAFHSLLLLSAASMALPQLLLLAPFYAWYLLVFLRAMSPRVAWASLIGLMLPYMFAFGWCALMHDFTFLLGRWHTLADVQPLTREAYTSLPHALWLAYGLPAILGLIASLHYLDNYYRDKIRPRMCLYVLVFQFALIEVATILQPAWAPALAAPMTATAATLIAHLFTLSREWWATPLLILALATLAAQAAIPYYIR